MALFKSHHVLMLGALALTACNGKTKDTGTTDTSTTDTGTSSTYLTPYSIAFQFYFGYHKDDTTDQFVTYQANQNGTMVTQDMAAALILFQEGSNGATGDSICTVVVSQPGPIDPVPLNDAAVKKGFIFDWTKATMDTSDCDGLLDPAVWGSDLQTSLETVQWGVGLTGAVDSDVQTAILNQVDDDQNWTGYLAGARPYLSTTGTLESSTGEFYAARGTQMDTTTTPPTLQFDDTNHNGAWEQGEPGLYISGTDVANGPVTGGYYVLSPFGLSFQTTPLDQVLMSSP